MREIEIVVVVGVTRLPEYGVRGQGLDTREICTAELIPQVDFVRFKLCKKSIAIRDDLVDDLVQLRPPAPIQRIRNQDDLFRTVPALELERSDTDGKRVIRHVVDVRILRQQVLGKYARVRAAAREERRSGR